MEAEMANRPVRILAVLALTFAAAVGGSVAAQGTTSPDVLSALLVEVRGLRAAMETMASAGPRIELALGRLQLQEQRVNNLLRRHTEVRERVAGAERLAEGIVRDIETSQQALEQGGFDEKDRKSIQGHLAHEKHRLTQINADVQRLRAEEIEVSQLVALEQGRWTEINQRLEELERALIRK
jgi:hypothetical protein